MTKRRFTHCLCIFLLLFAQQSALAHAAWHAYAHPPVHHEEHDDASFQGELCGLDGAFIQVLGGVQAAGVHHVIPQGAPETMTYRPGAHVVLELHLPLSRGPPVLS